MSVHGTLVFGTLRDVIPAYYFDDPAPADDHPLDTAAREAIERANGGTVFPPARTFVPMHYADRATLEHLRSAARHVEHDDAAAETVANSISVRQSATETPAQFVRRIALALLRAATERAAR